MKKTYIAPTMQVFTMQMTQKLCMASLKSNVDFVFEGGTPEEFNDNDDWMR